MTNIPFPDDHSFDVTVTRKSQLMEKSVPMQIMINGYRAGVLQNGQTETYQVAGSQAQIQAFLSMSKTRPLLIQAADGDGKSYVVQSNMNNVVYITGFSLVIISTILLFTTYDLWYMLIAAPPALYHLYIRFIRRDTYLVIREIKGSTANAVKEVF